MPSKIMLLILASFLPNVLAQVTSSVPFSSTASLPSTLLTSISSLPTSLARPTFSDLAPGGSATASSSPTTFDPDDPSSPLSSTDTTASQISSSENDDDDGGTNLLNYYFVFLALFLLAVIAIFYLLHRRRRMQRLHRQAHTQQALSRDLRGWSGGPRGPGGATARRWVHGRGGSGSQQEGWRRSAGSARTETERHEGLNELGEAPPPYLPKEEERDEASGVAIPLRTLDPGRGQGKLPGYGEVVVGSREDVGGEGSSSMERGRQEEQRWT
ncbi:hypothetical protein LTS18_007962 [Coniosporium uncinatum]|uniref:Uncharacterized protein n=1 Tax=Coniosporium uncinatum TaxID=93489 RepID=A0ACC3D2J4_9PEZI|nr:hypothetical protein LTS18_007962 [Coniosporium uncinatum]